MINRTTKKPRRFDKINGAFFYGIYMRHPGVAPDILTSIDISLFIWACYEFESCMNVLLNVFFLKI
ncbi:hypothetical protein LP065_08805 [Latilactobacillus sakei]|nr:hypothetical protein LP065_08805 [Latilactobacillus sakei]USF95872.1 hypothetical protein A4W82_03185 [Latilactobacillus sakei]